MLNEKKQKNMIIQLSLRVTSFALILLIRAWSILEQNSIDLDCGDDILVKLFILTCFYTFLL